MLGDTFTLFRPVYYLITLLLVCNFVYVVFLNNKIKASSYILFNSLFFVIIAAVLLFQEGIIVDEANLAGDPVTFVLTILFGILFIASFMFMNIKKRKA
ncbi:hypothetical protein CN330_22775 [Priestia megaterium]|nr:hypothetical protein CN330_22775 [Priestia megaterium]